MPYELSFVELEPAETVERDGYAITADPRQPPRRGLPSAMRSSRSRVPGTSTRSWPSSWASRPGRTSDGCSAVRPSTACTPEQVMGPTREGRKVVLSGDTEPCEALAIAAHQADVLVHEATFAEEEAERARQTAHSTARQAAELARDAEVRLLALTHISSRYAGRELREQARAVFAATEVPRDFDTIEVPFPERGAAELIRWSERQARERDVARRAKSGAAPRLSRRPDTVRKPPLTRSREARKETMDTAARRSSSSEEDVRRALVRVAHEIIERNPPASGPGADRYPPPRRVSRTAPASTARRAARRGDPARRSRHRLLPRRRRSADPTRRSCTPRTSTSTSPGARS